MDFLNNLDLKQNELRNAVVQKLATAPSSPVDGQIYYNTSNDILWLRSGGNWVDLTSQGDITGITSSTANQLTISSGTGPVPAISVVTGAIVAGNNNLATAQQIVDYVGSISSGVVSVGSGSATTISIGGTASAPTVAATTAAIADGGTALATADQIHAFVTGFGYSTTVGTVTNVTAGDGIRITGTSTVNPTVSVQTAGASNYIEVASLTTTADSGDKIAIGNASENVEKVTLGNIPMAALSAVKTYVDTAVAGASSFQGGYNASTNSPNLEAPGAGTVLQGFQWSVTNDGLFFTEQVRTGDLLIANIDNPSALADWTTVQSNVDLATDTVAGIASFSSSNFSVSSGGAVTIKNNGVLLGTETVGNYVATVGTSDGLSNTTGTGEGSSPTISLNFTELPEATGNQFVMYTTSEGVPRRTTPAGAAALINPSNTFAATVTLASNSVTHGLGTTDVIVQLFDTASGETVYADVTRQDPNSIEVVFSGAQTQGVRVLVTKIG